MKKILTTLGFIFIITTANYSQLLSPNNFGVKKNLNISSIENTFCEECSQDKEIECKEEKDIPKNLEFASIYKYNSNAFTSCHFNTPNSEYVLKNNKHKEINYLEPHEIHTYEMTYKIRKHHKNMIDNNTRASYNYVVILNNGDYHNLKAIDYGIKLKIQ